MKRNIAIVLVVFLVLGGMLLARKETILKVKVRTANVRSGPNAVAPVIAKVAAGTLLEVAGRHGAWYEVTVNNRAGKEVSGYIHNSVVDVIAGEEEEALERPRAASRRHAPGYRAAKKFARSGVKLLGGLSMNNLNFSVDIPASVAKKNSRTGFTAGVGFESGGWLAIELDLLYSPGGAVLKPVDPGDTGTIKQSLSYNAITAPILFKIRFMPGTTPYLLAGGEIGYLLNQKMVLTAENGTESERDLGDDVNRFQFGMDFGGGVELQAGRVNLLLEARYRLGLSKLFEPLMEANESIKATALIFLLGIMF